MNSICNLFDINDFNRCCIQESTSFNVLHLNIRSVLGNNFDEGCSGAHGEAAEGDGARLQ